MDNEAAQTVALKALQWLASNEDLLKNFMVSTGCSPDTLKTRLDDPELLLSVLDFIMVDDERVLGFCKVVDFDPHKMASLRESFWGGQEVNWI